MFIRSVISAVLLAFVAVTAPAPAHAATGYSYIATAGGTLVQALDATISSDLTAQSGVTGGPAGRSNDNAVASVSVSGLISTGAIETSATSAAIPDGVRVTSQAETARLNVLNGLITADAVRTTATTTGSGGSATSFDGGTEFVNLKIVGVKLPLNIPRNYAVTVPGVAQISINGFVSAEENGARATQAWGLGIVLLKAQGNAPAGARIYANPIFQMVVPTPPAEGANLDGNAFGTRVEATVDGSVRVFSGPTAMVRTPYTSSYGKTITNNTAAVNIPGVLTTAAVGSTTTSNVSGASDAVIRNVNEVARVNVLGGVVTADAVKVTAEGRQVNGNYQSTMQMTLLNLKVAGQAIPLDVSPNTTIDVAGLGRVVINQQIQQGKLNIIRAVHITLDTAQAGLPVGAKIEVAVAATKIG